MQINEIGGQGSLADSDGRGATPGKPEQPGLVAILMGTWNGQAYLPEQMESFLHQTHGHWSLWVSDDGSADDTREIIHSYAERVGSDRIHLVDGPHRGFAANFMSLACRDEIKADYYAFSDQDDIWLDGKLARAVSWLDGLPKDKPALYCGRTLMVDRQGKILAPAPLHGRTPSFANAIVESLASGNTMVFNEAARQLLRKTGADTKIISHDWWLYLLVSACGGVIRYDTDPTIHYRQHGANIIGADPGLKSRIIRILIGDFTRLVTTNVAALEKLVPIFTAENQKVFRRFTSARLRSLIPRCLGVLRSGVYRQTRMGTVGLIVATLLGKI